MKNILIVVCLSIFAAKSVFAATNETTAAQSSPASGYTRYGLFNLLDHRSGYGLGVYPEPFLVDDSDYEPGEARFDWVHTGAGGQRDDVLHPEVEIGFDELTVEVEFPYERVVSDGTTAVGFDNVDVGARYPLAQWVSPDGLFDTSAGVGIEAGIPTGSAVGQNAELVPKVFDDVKVGNFTVQSIFGYSALFGPGDDGGLHTFEYGFVFGYTLQHQQLPLPDVLQTIPFFELIGSTELNHDNPDHNQLLGNAGLRFNLKAIGPVQPRPGIGFIFPMNSGARQNTHWGVITSFVFEF
jgi:hypothetical protein